MRVNWTCSYRKTIIFLFLICLLHLLAMFDGYMILSCFVLSFQTLEILLFMYVFFKHGCNLNSMLVVYGIDLFNPFYSRSMSLVSLRASLGGGGRLAQGTRPLMGILPYVVLLGCLSRWGVFSPAPFGK